MPSTRSGKFKVEGTAARETRAPARHSARLAVPPQHPATPPVSEPSVPPVVRVSDDRSFRSVFTGTPPSEAEDGEIAATDTLVPTAGHVSRADRSSSSSGSSSSSSDSSGKAGLRGSLASPVRPSPEQEFAPAKKESPSVSPTVAGVERDPAADPEDTIVVASAAAPLLPPPVRAPRAPEGAAARG